MKELSKINNVIVNYNMCLNKFVNVCINYFHLIFITII